MNQRIWDILIKQVILDDKGNSKVAKDLLYLNMDYKITFMSNYEELDILNDNIDVKIALSTDLVYAATLYTISNINKLIENTSPKYFVSSEMIIVQDLSYSTINKVITDIMKNDLMHLCMSNVGSINQVYPKANSLADIKNYGSPVTGFYQ